ncbi:hypothetical protein GGI12_001922 [Dipsacomyces acuminosporus]|nr:hypothetical protein GGI12_001922 [Dipsacomyces acuminosporus]
MNALKAVPRRWVPVARSHTPTTHSTATGSNNPASTPTRTATDSGNARKCSALPAPASTQNSPTSQVEATGSRSKIAEITHGADIAARARTDNKHGCSSEDKPVKDSDDAASDMPTPSFDESYEETGLAEAVTLKTPDLMAVPAPMFATNSKVEIPWGYTNAALRPPKRLNSCGRLTPGYNPSAASAVEVRALVVLSTAGLCALGLIAR